MRLIDADALKEKLRKLPRWIVRKDNSHNEGFTYDQVFFAIDAQPEQKTGRWILKPNIYGVVYCSECGYAQYINNTNYCPNCGARMEVDDG